ncbi:tetratricopeptide repeat protein [Sulfurospirillum deleyianum]|uniref:TPR repeat-containing protein n=1 Tax=Sulfurospirillum deleyianum (strain ATCC 51133 / DSM 6946 / 5175) TaxID=525898 RepID=D1AZ52_SULD5|nr:hypothetical protein [Sulfurospirillum deleyianum]ACZ11190.1 TPR repeat-containing protein [Sulfurospirillum deleyianum DSM 6946]
MKLLLFLFFLSVQLFSLELVLNSGKESKTNYAILHIMDAKPFLCETMVFEKDKKQYLCQVDRPITKRIESKKTKYAELDFYEKGGQFYILIDPKVNSKLIPIEEELYNTTEILTKPKTNRYTHWSILLEEKALFEAEAGHDGLDFPVQFSKNERPSIGALDLNGAPISYAQSKDIGLYLEIKKAYYDGYDESVIKDVKRVLSLYPNSIFRSELELFQMRSMDKLLSARSDESPEFAFNEGDMITLAKQWSKEFTSDENLPEVLMFMAKAYLKSGAKADANYVLDILVDEHPQSSFTKRAILLFADNLFLKKEKDKALKLYLDVLYSAQDLDIASEAAIRLSDHQMDAGKMQEAKEYLFKVLNVNAQFLLKDKERSYKLARRLAEHKLYDLAAKVADVLLQGISEKAENREILLKESGDWHAKANEVEAAHSRYKEYLAAYKNTGDYVQEVTESLDTLFFRLNENNETKLAAYYDTLIEKYANNEIGQRALLEKANLLLKQKAYAKVLALEEALTPLPETFDLKPAELIYAAAKGLSVEHLNQKACQESVLLIEQYTLHIDEPVYQEALFNCFMATARYENAHEISRSHLQDASLKERYAWAQKEVQALYKMGEYEEAVAFKEDLKTLSFSLREKISLDSIRTLFFALVKLKNNDGALSLAQSIGILYPNEASNLDIYDEIITIASETKNDLLLVKYAKMIVDEQKKYQSTALSPRIEFSYIEALKRLGRDDEALTLAESLMGSSLKNEDKIRLFYHAGELSLKLKEREKAKAYFTQCVENNESSSWKKICEENLKLF